MREILSSVTTKGQVTIPIEIRRLLGVNPRDKVVFIVDDGQVRLLRGGSVVARTAGAVKVVGPPLSARELREEFERGVAEEVLERMGR
jgi:antitoxin PrlF